MRTKTEENESLKKVNETCKEGSSKSLQNESLRQTSTKQVVTNLRSNQLHQTSQALLERIISMKALKSQSDLSSKKIQQSSSLLKNALSSSQSTLVDRQSERFLRLSSEGDDNLESDLAIRKFSRDHRLSEEYPNTAKIVKQQ